MSDESSSVTCSTCGHRMNEHDDYEGCMWEDVDVTDMVNVYGCQCERLYLERDE